MTTAKDGNLLIDFTQNYYSNLLGVGADFATSAMCYMMPSGGGRAVRAYVSDRDTNCISLSFERKITRNCVADGNLLPITIEKTKRRGGKRSLNFTISCESAEALLKVLKPAVRDARKRQNKANTIKRFSRLFVSFVLFTKETVRLKST